MMGKVILFNGNNLDGWTGCNGSAPTWNLEGNAMTVVKGHIISKVRYRDAHIHVEFRVPDMTEASGQHKGNSGVFLQGHYEIQVLDSYGYVIPGTGDCGAVYHVHAPLVNACRKAMEWQTYDIVFRSPRTGENGAITECARMTVFHNGLVIHNNVEIKGPTVRMKFNEIDPDLTKPGPLLLQDHGHPVQYRNIWLYHLPEKGSDSYTPL